MISSLTPESHKERVEVLRKAAKSPKLVEPQPKPKTMLDIEQAVEDMERRAEFLDLPWVEPVTPTGSIKLPPPLIGPATPTGSTRLAKTKLNIVTNINSRTATKRPDTPAVSNDQEESGPSAKPKRPDTPTVTIAEEDANKVLTPAATICESPRTFLKPPYPDSPSPPLTIETKRKVIGQDKGKGKKTGVRPPRIHVPPPQSFNGVFNPPLFNCPHKIDVNKRVGGVRNECRKCRPSYYIEHGIAPLSTPLKARVTVFDPRIRPRGLSHSDVCSCDSVDPDARCSNCGRQAFVKAAFDQDWV
ncbi:hypothetical protein F5Y18DRAFT_199438 [Xylariaceae sp. FL1019]|nr:hypothetical protein F5Y18DRAFT_199438 [Xylariaceae sp. FL1019]